MTGDWRWYGIVVIAAVGLFVACRIAARRERTRGVCRHCGAKPGHAHDLWCPSQELRW